MKEEWKPIPGYEGYEVSNHGRVRSVDRTVQCRNGQTRRRKGKLMKPWKRSDGYLRIGLYGEGGKQRVKYIHRLVLEAFVGPCPDGMECLHGDGNSENNRLDNLRWGTSSENNLDMVRHGNHRNARKAHCPQGHEYTPGNTRERRGHPGHRQCIACHRAKAYIQYYPELQDRLQQIADRYYRAILEEATDTPVVARSRDAKEIMDRRRNERREQQ